MKIETTFTKQYPTQGDLAREQVRRSGVPYFTDVQAEIRRRLGRLAPRVRTAFALTCAQRLLSWHEQLPGVQQSAFTLSWRPVLDNIWRGLDNESENTKHHVRQAVGAFRAGPYDHDDGQDGPQEAGDCAAAACIYAAECYLEGDVDSACWSSDMAIDFAFRCADGVLQLDPNNFMWDPSAEPMPLAKEAMHAAVQRELRKQLVHLDLLEATGVSSSVLDELRRSAT